MKPRQKRLMVALGVAIGMVPLVLMAQGLLDQAGLRLGDMQAKEGVIELYGKVVDQNGEPVEGATMAMQYHQASLLPSRPIERRATTAADGSFAFAPERSLTGQIVKGTTMFIKAIEKPGYEFDRGQQPQVYFETRLDSPERFTADPQRPVVFRVRKMHWTSLLLENPGAVLSIHLEETTGTEAVRSKVKGFDLALGLPLVDHLTSPSLTYDRPPTHDLLMRGDFETSTQRWTITLMPGNPEGGIMVSDQRLGEAPADGYQPSVKFALEPGQYLRGDFFYTHIYLKSRVPPIYSWIGVNAIQDIRERQGATGQAKPRLVRITVYAYTNPYGERVLDPEPSIPSRLVVQWRKEAQEKLARGERPQLPDFLLQLRARSR